MSAGGSQEAGFKNTLVETKDDVFNLVWGWFCTRHQLSLAQLADLKTIDRTVLKKLNCGWKFFGSTCKIMHCWSDFARTVFFLWKDAFGAETALKHAKTKPPLCKGGDGHFSTAVEVA